MQSSYTAVCDEVIIPGRVSASSPDWHAVHLKITLFKLWSNWNVYCLISPVSLKRWMLCHRGDGLVPGPGISVQTLWCNGAHFFVFDKLQCRILSAVISVYSLFFCSDLACHFSANSLRFYVCSSESGIKYAQAQCNYDS